MLIAPNYVKIVYVEPVLLRIICVHKKKVPRGNLSKANGIT